MSVLDQANVSVDDEFLAKTYGPMVHDITKGARTSAMNGYNNPASSSVPSGGKSNPVSMSYYHPNNGGSSSPELAMQSLHGMRGVHTSTDAAQNGRIPTPLSTNINSPTSQNGISEEEFGSDGINSRGSDSTPPVVYPWMKRIHVSHGKWTSVFGPKNITHDSKIPMIPQQ